MRKPLFACIALALAPAAGAAGFDVSCPAPGAGFQQAAASLLGGCEKASSAAGAMAVPEAFHDERLMDDDPSKTASRAQAGAMADTLPKLALCARLSQGAGGANAAHALAAYLAQWSQRYQGDGNPVNESNLIPLLLSAAIAQPVLSPEDRQAVTAGAENLEQKLASFWQSPPEGGRLPDNWTTDTLVLETLSALAQANDAKLADARGRLNAQLIKQLTPPASWKPRADCPNLAEVGAYGSSDLQQRDAVTYHIRGIGRAVMLLALAPQLFDEATKDKLREAFEITRPYVTGERAHLEFLCTTAPIDRARAAHGERQYSGAAPWQPAGDSSTREAFRWARVAFPSIRPWTGAFAGTNQRAWVKALAACKGDAVISGG